MLIAGGLVYDYGDTDRPAQADILIDGNRIAVVGPGLRVLHPNAPVVDARDHLVLPGFINAHYHSHDTLLKGFFEAVPVELWSVLALPPSFPRRSRRELRARTLIGAVECLHGGITTVKDMDRVHPFDPADVDVVLEAYDEVGIRCILRRTSPSARRWRPRHSGVTAYPKRSNGVCPGRPGPCFRRAPISPLPSARPSHLAANVGRASRSGSARPLRTGSVPPPSYLAVR